MRNLKKNPTMMNPAKMQATKKVLKSLVLNLMKAEAANQMAAMMLVLKKILQKALAKIALR